MGSPALQNMKPQRSKKELSAEEREYIRNIYYDTAGADSYGSVKRLYDRIKRDGRYKISLSKLEAFMEGEEVYHSHRAKQRRKFYPKIIVPEPGYQLSMDTAYINMGGGRRKRKYLVLAVDDFSRQVAGRTVADLKADTMNKAVNSILNELGYKYRFVRTDRGTDYTNRKVQATFKKRKMVHFPSFEPNKTQTAERSIRSIKNRLYRVLQRRGDANWSRYLKDVINAHNHTKSRALFGISPSEVKQSNVPQLWFKMKEHEFLHEQPKERPFKYDKGQQVKVLDTRQPMRKEFSETVGEQVFTVHERISRGHNHLYKLKDPSNGVIMEGVYGEDQLVKVRVGDDSELRIERIVGRKTVRGGKMLKVRGLGFDASHDSWEPASSVRNLKDGT